MKFELDEKVFYLYHGKVHSSKVHARMYVDSAVDTDMYYGVDHGVFPGDQLFKTLGDLIEHTNNDSTVKSTDSDFFGIEGLIEKALEKNSSPDDGLQDAHYEELKHELQQVKDDLQKLKNQLENNR